MGLAASAAMAVAGPALVTASDGHSTAWWYAFTIAPSEGDLGNFVLFYAGMITLSVAWLGLGRRLRQGAGDGGHWAQVTPTSVCMVGALWALPLVLGPPLFSQDIYSYAGQGMLAHVGLSPYVYGPGVLSVWGHPGLVKAVSPVWRATPAPYGPAFLALASTVVGASASLVVVAVELRLLEVVGVLLLAVFVPRLARVLGADPTRAAWLAVLSPLLLLSVVAAGHNDALMVGLLVVGVTLAMERRPMVGIAVCALAATIKLPAAAGIVFIAVAWARDQPTSASRVKVLGAAGLATAAVFTGLSVGTGLGWGWLSAHVLLSTTGVIQVVSTPATALGMALASALHALDLGPSTNTLVSVLRAVGLAGAAVAGLFLLWRTRWENLVLCLGVALLVVVVAGPVTWPWYLMWSVPLLVACPSAQRSRALVVMLAAVGFLVGPAGSMVLRGGAAPVVAVAVVVAAVLAWRTWRQPLLDQLSPQRGLMPSVTLGTGAPLVRSLSVTHPTLYPLPQAEAGAPGRSEHLGAPGVRKPSSDPPR